MKDAAELVQAELLLKRIAYLEDRLEKVERELTYAKWAANQKRSGEGDRP